jgi:hypothetical protein
MSGTHAGVPTAGGKVMRRGQNETIGGSYCRNGEDLTPRSSSLESVDHHACAGIPGAAKPVTHQPFSVEPQVGLNDHPAAGDSPVAGRY